MGKSRSNKEAPRGADKRASINVFAHRKAREVADGLSELLEENDSVFEVVVMALDREKNIYWGYTPCDDIPRLLGCLEMVKLRMFERSDGE
jgi:hypothetical protein